MARSESLAYANSNSNMSRLVLFFRSHSTAVTATVGFLIFILLVTSDAIMKGSSDGYSGLRTTSVSSKAGWGGAVHTGYFTTKDSINGNTFSFAAVTDMDQLSRIEGSDKPIFHSWFLPGTVTYDAKSNTYSYKLGEVRELISGHNEAGRGMELSEMTLYQNRLLAFDDRTGSVFEILSESKDKSFVAPRFVITEGEGDTDKGMKWEWATVKGNELYIGSMGKEYTKPDGTIVNTNNLWIAKINENGEVTREDWSDKYKFVREQLGASPPGYVIHEAVLWSEKTKKWLFIPRRISTEMYDDVADERRGTNKLLIVNEKFTDAKLVDIKMTVDPLHGFSTAAFVPNSDEKHILALRSVEEDCAEDLVNCKQRTYIMIFDLDGNVLLEETEISDTVKYEGVEFVDIQAMS